MAVIIDGSESCYDGLDTKLLHMEPHESILIFYVCLYVSHTEPRQQPRLREQN